MTHCAPSLAASRELLLKRCLDIVISLAVLVVVWPVLAMIALVIRLDSPGPVIFRQERVGRGGRVFEMWKFRTMVHGAPEEPHRNLVVPLVRGVVSLAPGAARRVPSAPPPDPRITRSGKWLRRSSLDELPQLVNVLRGEMSLVGPRPATLYERAEFDARLQERLLMPQGMTGRWQVSGCDRLDYVRMYELDLEYVRSWSLWLDLKILAATPRAMVVPRESAS